MWRKSVIDNSHRHIVIVLVGNKSDSKSPEKLEVPSEEAREYAESKKMLFFECSVKDNIGIDKVTPSINSLIFQLSIEEIFNRVGKEEILADVEGTQGVKISNTEGVENSILLKHKNSIGGCTNGKCCL